ncbi:GTP-binding protein [Rhodanobacter lindaniclasticus]
MLPDDQLAALSRESRRLHADADEGVLDFALLTDGLDAEREHGHHHRRGVSLLPHRARSFIAADCPGDEQYTRNMATGASNAELAVVLVDARKGVLTRSRRHTYICGLLGIRHVLLAVNKMDRRTTARTCTRPSPPSTARWRAAWASKSVAVRTMPAARARDGEQRCGRRPSPACPGDGRFRDQSLPVEQRGGTLCAGVARLRARSRTCLARPGLAGGESPRPAVAGRCTPGRPTCGWQRGARRPRSVGRRRARSVAPAWRVVTSRRGARARRRCRRTARRSLGVSPASARLDRGSRGHAGHADAFARLASVADQVTLRLAVDGRDGALRRHDRIPFALRRQCRDGSDARILSLTAQCRL